MKEESLPLSSDDIWDIGTKAVNSPLSGAQTVLADAIFLVGDQNQFMKQLIYRSASETLLNYVPCFIENSS